MIPDSTLIFFAKYIEAELGIVYAEHNFFQLKRRLEDIASTMNCSINDLYKQSQSGVSGQLKQLLLDTATNNETSFFRDPRVFNAIEHAILSIFSDSATHLKIWSAASSTGQEPLSVAMLIQEFIERQKKPFAFSILASDISERVLEKAKSAVYSSLEISRGLPSDLLNKYFVKNESDNWVASQKLTKHIEFKKVNLKESFHSLDRYHLVLCRNVLIYQNVEGKKEILKRVLSQMEPNGFLVLGAGETLIGISDEFESVESDGVILYRKKSKESAAA